MGPGEKLARLQTRCSSGYHYEEGMGDGDVGLMAGQSNSCDVERGRTEDLMVGRV